MKTKSVAFLLVISILMFPLWAFAQDDASPVPEAAKPAPMILTVEDAIKIGLANSIDMKVLANETAKSEISLEKAGTNKRDLVNANSDLNKASTVISGKEGELAAAQAQVNAIKDAISKGASPQDLPLRDANGNPYNDIETVKSVVNVMQATINENSEKLAKAKSDLAQTQDKYNEILSNTAQAIGDKINFGSITTLTPKGAGDLMESMANVNYAVTLYAQGIYKNQIAMLIQKSYYDALNEQKILELKKTAMERGKKQAEILKLSYENGMKAKDDLLLANMYYDSTKIAYQMQQANYENALIELKKNINIDLDTPITLQENMITEVTEESLSEGIESALENRLEIRKALGQITVYQLNEKAVRNVGYSENTYPVKEAVLLTERAGIELQKTTLEISSQVRQSYNTMISTGNMLKEAQNLISDAQDVVRIAQLKYEQGYGADNALLKQLNLSDSSGTVVELIAAQEKLDEVEEQVAKLTYGYTMAKIKYMNDIGKLMY